MTGYERIRAHCEWLGMIGMPQDRVLSLEAVMVREWVRWKRERSAELLLAEEGATNAATHLGCDRATVYRRARKSQKLRKTATV